MWRRQRPGEKPDLVDGGGHRAPLQAPARRRARRTRRRASAGSARPPRRRGRPPRARRARRAGRAGRPGAGTESRRARTSSSGSRRSNSRAALASSPSAGTVTCTRRSPTRAFSSAGVPAATVLPPRSTTISSASRSASSRYCVVSSSAAPSCDEALDRAPHLGPAGRVQAGGRLVEEDDRAVHDQAGGEVQPAAHAAASRCRPGGRRRGRSRSARAARRARDASPLESFCRRPSSIRFSRPVRRSSSEACWPASEIGSRTAPGSRTTSWPPTSARPVVGASSVVRMRTAVVLPAPLWPSRPSTVPGSTADQAAQRLGLAEALAQVLGEDRSLSYVVRHSTAYDRSTLYEMSSEPKPPIWARPEPRGRGQRGLALARRRSSRSRSADRRRGRPRGGLDPPARARAALGRDVALPLLRQPRRAARADGRHGRGARCSCPSCRPTGAPRCRRSRTTAAPRSSPTRGCCRRCRSARAVTPEPAAPHRAVRAVGRRRSAERGVAAGAAERDRDRRRRLHDRLHAARARPAAPTERGRRIAARFAEATTSRTSAICSRAASSRCSRSSSAAGSSRRRPDFEVGLAWLLDGFEATRPIS